MTRILLVLALATLGLTVCDGVDTSPASTATARVPGAARSEAASASQLREIEQRGRELRALQGGVGGVPIL